MSMVFQDMLIIARFIGVSSSTFSHLARRRVLVRLVRYLRMRWIQWGYGESTLRSLMFGSYYSRSYGLLLARLNAKKRELKVVRACDEGKQ